MTRRASLPGASELFRTTSSRTDAGAAGAGAAYDSAVEQAPRTFGGSAQDVRSAQAGTAAQSSGRKKHDSKITVYLSADELLAMEQARLTLRGAHDLPVDRGRMVREAVAVLLEDFDENGAESVLVQRLRGRRAEG